MKALCSALLGLVTALALSTQAFADLRVGFIGGFSGPGKAFGDAARNGFELAREEFGPQHITVIYEDDQFDPKKTVGAFTKLVHTDKVDLLVVLGSTPAATIAPLAEKKGIPTLAWASAEQVAQGRRWTIRSWASSREEGRALADKARELGLKRVATLAYTDEYALSVEQGFRSSFGSEAVSLGEVLATEQDFASVILQAKGEGVDGIALCLSVGQGARFAKQMQQLYVKATILGCETFNSSQERELSQGALEGAWFASVPVAAEFQSRYKDRFKVDTSIGGSAVHYELYRILREIAPSTTSREQIREKFLSVRGRESAVGRFDIIARDGDQWFNLPIGIHKISPVPELPHAQRLQADPTATTTQHIDRSIEGKQSSEMGSGDTRMRREPEIAKME